MRGHFGAVLLMALFIAGDASAEGEPQSVGPGEGVVLPSGDDNPCPGSELLLNADGGFENGYAWEGGGVVPPDYGAFAEGYEGSGTVCGIQLYLTTLPGYFIGQSMDCYLWSSDGTNPDQVLSFTWGIVPEPPAIWPEISVHDIALPETGIDGGFFVGTWGNWPQMLTGWFVAADINGPGGLPRVKIAPGIGYPTGWHDPSIVWGPTQAMGIGAYLKEGVIPSLATSWGRIKALY